MTNAQIIIMVCAMITTTPFMNRLSRKINDAPAHNQMNQKWLEKRRSIEKKTTTNSNTMANTK